MRHKLCKELISFVSDNDIYNVYRGANLGYDSCDILHNIEHYSNHIEKYMPRMEYILASYSCSVTSYSDNESDTNRKFKNKIVLLKPNGMKSNTESASANKYNKLKSTGRESDKVNLLVKCTDDRSSAVLEFEHNFTNESNDALLPHRIFMNIYDEKNLSFESESTGSFFSPRQYYLWITLQLVFNDQTCQYDIFASPMHSKSLHIIESFRISQKTPFDLIIYDKSHEMFKRRTVKLSRVISSGAYKIVYSAELLDLETEESHSIAVARAFPEKLTIRKVSKQQSKYKELRGFFKILFNLKRLSLQEAWFQSFLHCRLRHSLEHINSNKRVMFAKIPRILFTTRCNDNVYIGMDKLDVSLDKFIIDNSVSSQFCAHKLNVADSFKYYIHAVASTLNIFQKDLEFMHGDLHPANIMLSKCNGVVHSYIIDFGRSSIAHRGKRFILEPQTYQINDPQTFNPSKDLINLVHRCALCAEDATNLEIYNWCDNILTLEPEMKRKITTGEDALTMKKSYLSFEPLTLANTVAAELGL